MIWMSLMCRILALIDVFFSLRFDRLRSRRVFLAFQGANTLCEELCVPNAEEVQWGHECLTGYARSGGYSNAWTDIKDLMLSSSDRMALLNAKQPHTVSNNVLQWNTGCRATLRFMAKWNIYPLSCHRTDTVEASASLLPTHIHISSRLWPFPFWIHDIVSFLPALSILIWIIW